MRYQRGWSKEETDKFLSNADNQVKAFQVLYAKEIAAFRSNLKSIRQRMKELDDSTKERSNDDYLKRFAELKDEYYDGAFFTFVKSLDSSPSFLLDFKNFYRYIVTKAISKSLNQDDLITFIKVNQFNKIQIEGNLQSIAHYVERVNANFSSMTQEEHICFFILLNNQLKLHNIDVETLNHILIYASLACWQENEWIDLVLASADLTPSDFIYLILFYLTAGTLGTWDNATFNFLEEMIPLLEKASYSNQRSNSFTESTWYQPFFDKWMSLAIHNPLLMRLISSREDLVKNLDPNALIKYDDQVKPASFFILKMMSRDDVFADNLIYRSYVLEKLDLSQQFLIANKINGLEEIINILKNIIQKKNSSIWGYFSLSTLEFIHIYDENYSPKAEFHLLKRKMIDSYNKLVNLYRGSVELTEINKGRGEHRHAMSSFFDKLKTSHDMRIEIVNDDFLFELFAFHIHTFLGYTVLSYVKDGLEECLIGMIEASDQKKLIWKKIIEESPDLIDQIKNAKSAVVSSLYSLAPSFKKICLDFIEEERNKKKAFNGRAD